MQQANTITPVLNESDANLFLMRSSNEGFSGVVEVMVIEVEDFLYRAIGLSGRTIRFKVHRCKVAVHRLAHVALLAVGIAAQIVGLCHHSAVMVCSHQLVGCGYHLS